MEKAYLQLIELVRRVIKEDDKELNEELFPNLQDVNMWKRIYDIAVVQEVQVFLYEATKKLDLPEQVKKNFYSVYNRAVRKEAIMHLEVSKYFEELDKSKVTYLPIKGWKIKELYAKPYLRTMTDVDVIVREDDFEDACRIATDCGFLYENEDDNHCAFIKKPVTELEVHHQLFSKKSVLHNWGRRVFEKNIDFMMSDEDSYVYMIAHMAKHFTHSGAGMRNVIDCYLHNKHYSFEASQQRYINGTLKELELEVFESRIRNLSKVWFDEVEYDEESKLLSEYIMDGGLYGKQGNSSLLELGNNSTSKLSWLIKTVFPSYDFLKSFLRYKKMYKILLPVYWVIYLVKRLKRKGNMKLMIDFISKDEAELNKSKQILDYVGIKARKY